MKVVLFSFAAALSLAIVSSGNLAKGCDAFQQHIVQQVCAQPVFQQQVCAQPVFQQQVAYLSAVPVLSQQVFVQHQQQQACVQQVVQRQKIAMPRQRVFTPRQSVRQRVVVRH